MGLTQQTQALHEELREVGYCVVPGIIPGGKVAAMDEDPALADLCDGADADPVQRAVQIGAIREAFEEAGVLLARPADGDALVDGERVRAAPTFNLRVAGASQHFSGAQVSRDTAEIAEIEPRYRRDVAERRSQHCIHGHIGGTRL